MAQSYNPTEVEKKWQERWEADKLYQTRNDDPRPKWYALTMFPYTSGDFHIGHWYAIAPYDTHTRFKRMQGYNVLSPIGFDSFGLPAENAAIKRGIHPHTWTMGNIERMRRQIKSIGGMFDWSREVITCYPEYYKWNQWFFLQFYKKGLAYRAKASSWWCPSCQTVLANEQVLANGTCERCSSVVAKKDLEQWFFRITKYAEELLDFSKTVDWPERIKIMQRNWIGRSEGVELSFDISSYKLPEKEIRVFTTRPDTVYGVKFMVLAPEHPLVEKLTTPAQKAAVQAYVEASRRVSEIDRLSTEREKNGVFTGAYCINRFNDEKVPIWIADYVLLTYGTGCVMAVPAHDTRDFAFAKKYSLPVKVVIRPPEWDGGDLKEAYVESGPMVNSGPFDGTPGEKALGAIAEYAEKKGFGKRTVSYRLRDWLLSRQRYWGTPIPVVYCDKDGIVLVPEKDLPVLLPEDAEFRPTGESPLLFHKGFLKTTCPKCHGPARRETDTMDTFVDSSWYWYRYCSPHFDGAPFDKAIVKKWCPVDQYTGGAEHAVMHLLYSRFFVKAVRDVGLVEHDEPFLRLFNQGIILGEDHDKMSKSRGNVVNPDDYVSKLGADAVRCFLMFVGPWDQGGSWSSTGIEGISRWLNRLWTVATHDINQLKGASPDESAVKELKRITHKTIKRVTQDDEKFRYNTMLAALMEYTNYLGKVWESKSVGATSWNESVDALLLLLAPAAPHLAEELWAQRGRPYSIHNQHWPSYNEALAKDDEVTLVVQVNGKLRDKITVPASISEDEARSLALASDKVKPHLDGKEVRRVIYVPGKLVNVVVG